MLEQWKDIPSFEGRYIASNTGKIRTLVEFIDNPFRGKIRRQKNRHFGKDSIVGPKLSAKGYQRVNLGGVVYQVHRLVAMTWIPNTEDKPQINHIDGNKLNNHISNLEWVTNQENRDHAKDNNLICRRDRNCSYQKLTNLQCLDIINLYKTSKISQKKIGLLYGVCQQTISKIIRARA